MCLSFIRPRADSEKTHTHSSQRPELPQNGGSAWQEEGTDLHASGFPSSRRHSIRPWVSPLPQELRLLPKCCWVAQLSALKSSQANSSIPRCMRGTHDLGEDSEWGSRPWSRVPVTLEKSSHPSLGREKWHDSTCLLKCPEDT